MLVAFMPIIAIAETGSKYGDYLYYQINSDNTAVTITDCDTSAISIFIPDEIEGLPVTSIGDHAFWMCTKLSEITFTNNLTSSGSGAFRGCSSLTSVYITDIASYLNISFRNDESSPMCKASRLYINGKRATSIDIPDGITKIPMYALKGCEGLKKVTIPNSVTSIEEYAFSDCDQLTEITIPGSVTEIEWGAFNDCSNLTTVVIEEGIKNIIPAFQNCENLTSITFPNSVEKINWNGVLKGCNNLKELTIPFIGTTRDENLSSYSVLGNLFGRVSSSTTSDIEVTKQNYASGYSESYAVSPKLEKVTITDATQIPYGAFSNCKNIKEITIPKTVTKIDAKSFNGCTGLETLNFNAAKCQSTAENTFIECTALKNLNIGDDVITIYPNLFSKCTSLNKLVLGNSVSSIKDSAFEGCTGITQCFIPGSVTEIEQAAFKNCSALRTVTYDGTEEDWNEIYINKTDNEPLLNASRSYNLTPSSPTPTTAPTTSPSTSPSAVPTASPTISPSVQPSTAPTTSPDIEPTTNPTDSPVQTPDTKPTIPPNIDVNSKCIKITAVYSADGTLESVLVEKIKVSEITLFPNTKTNKIFYWDSLQSMKPLEWLYN